MGMGLEQEDGGGGSGVCVYAWHNGEQLFRCLWLCVCVYIYVYGNVM